MRVLKLWTSALIGLMILSVPLMAARAKPEQIIVIEGHSDAKDARAGGQRMHLLTFDVPAGVTRIEIKKQLDFGPDGKGTVDHGLADPRGAGFGCLGFRGWMGRVEDDIVLTGDPATTSPFFLAGPIQPGRWTLMQWTSSLPSTGVKYKYTVRLSFDGAVPPDRMPKVPGCDQGIINPKAGWYIGDLHGHTIYSKAEKTLSQLSQRHFEDGYDFFAATDHNINLVYRDFARTASECPKELILCGEEITHPIMHANVIGCQPGAWFDMRVGPDEQNHLPDVIAQAHRQGAIFSMNHPFRWNNKDWKIPPQNWKQADAVEVWNGKWSETNQMALDHWDSLLQQGRHLIAICGSDTHSGSLAHSPAVHVYAHNLSRSAIINGISKGHVFISENSKGPELYLSIRGESALPGDTIRRRLIDEVPVEVKIVGGDGKALRLVWPGGEMKVPVDKDLITIHRGITLDPSRSANYIRAELIKSDGKMAALTNPIYVKSAM